MSEPIPAADTRADELLAELADDFLRRHRAGEHPSLDDYCTRHPGLAGRIRDLFPAALAMEQPGIGATVDVAPPAERVGATIGRYKLLERIGEGGFGVVYMAEQQHPVRRRVALKVIKPGIDTRQVIARFEAERQALALMDHENIAKVLDAGATDSGRPYFVMELVHGVPITEYCDKNQLPPRERLELFVQICRAVQHAHTKGIIHRDIKPTNVLVTLHEGVAVPKVIDFGIAKATGQQLTEKTLFTNFAQMVGTPLYMSPEQAEMTGIDVDTRSDVYSLGVLLYELLTGTTPLDKERLKQAAFDEVRRIIREEEPPRPSTRLSTMGEQARGVSARRNSDPKRLGRLMRRELDWVVMKALEKERARRYETANGLARDVERYLRDEPVEACPPSAVYRIRKFVRRNKGPVAAAVVVLLTLMGGIVGTTFGLLRAERARVAAGLRAEGERRAKQEAQEREAETKAVLDFVERKVFAAARPQGQEGGLGHDVTLRRAMQAALPYVENSFADRPLIEARLRRTMAASFLSLGEHKIAVEQAEAALALYEKHRGPDHVDALQTMVLLGACYLDLDRNDDAVALHERALALAKRKLGPDHATTLATMSQLAMSYADVGRHEEALNLHEQQLALSKARGDPDDHDTLVSMANLANSYDGVGRQEDALRLREETLALMKAKLGPDHPNTLKAMSNLVTSYAAANRHAEALKLRGEALALRKAKLGDDHPDTLTDMILLAQDYAGLSRHAEALELYEAALAGTRRKMGPADPRTLRILANLARTYHAVGRFPDAEAASEQVLATHGDVPAANHYISVAAFDSLILALRAQRKEDEARAVEMRRLGIEIHLGTDAIRREPINAARYRHRAILLCRAGRFREAVADFDKAIELDPGNHSHYFFGAPVYLHSGDVEGYRRVCRQMVQRFGKTETPEVGERIAKASLIEPDPDADLELSAALVERAVAVGPSHPYIAWFKITEALTEYRRGRYAQAIEAVKAVPEAGAIDPYSRGLARLVVAMSHAKAGRTDQARQTLADAEAEFDALRAIPRKRDLGFDGNDVSNWCTYQIVLAQARTVVNGPSEQGRPQTSK
jgi:tetratricopeptide (TPR) repeat protein/tRNA A-37 threonylcarbamoyl transferase component Bud32